MLGLQHKARAVGILVAHSLAVLVACSSPPPPRLASSKPIKLRSFTEASPVRSITVAGDAAFVASDGGLDRWDLSSGVREELLGEEALSSDAVLAMAHDAERGWLWLATRQGLARYELSSATFVTMEQPRTEGESGELSRVVLATDEDGVWVGLSSGLHHVDTEGAWQPTEVTADVRALVRLEDGGLWLGTATGLLLRRPGGPAVAFSEEQGCQVGAMTLLVARNGGEVLGVGTYRGQQRIVVAQPEGCTTYRASPLQRWISAVRQDERVLILSEEGMYSLGGKHLQERRLQRRGMRLLPVFSAPGTPRPRVLRLTRVPLEPPTGATALAVHQDRVMVGTSHLGTAMLSSRDATRWLRRAELVGAARTMSVACRSLSDCYLATGDTFLWHYDGSGFSRVERTEQARYLSVLRRGSQIVVLRTADDSEQREVEVWVRGASRFRRVEGLSLQRPGPVRLRFARAAPDGRLWVGLESSAGTEPVAPGSLGVSLIDLGANSVVDLAMPPAVDEPGSPTMVSADQLGKVLDVAFATEDPDLVWMATASGVIRWEHSPSPVFPVAASEAEHGQLRSVVAGRGGVLFAATSTGVGRLEGSAWQYPPSLRGSINDVAISMDGRLWIATDHGLGVYDGRKIRRLDVRWGLVENTVVDIEADRFGRIWVRGRQGVGLLTP